MKYNINYTFEIPDEDKFGILKQWSEIKGILLNLFEYPILLQEIYFRFNIHHDEVIEDKGFFVEDENGKEYFSFTDIKGYYRPAKKDHDIIDITVLNDKGEDITVMQFEVHKNYISEFIDDFESYINYYSLKHDTRFEVKPVK